MPNVIQQPESRRIIKLYNRVAQVLLEYEMLYHNAWTRSLDIAKEGT